MTAAWIIVAIALAAGAFLVGWCVGCDTGEREERERWRRSTRGYDLPWSPSK